MLRRRSEWIKSTEALRWEGGAISTICLSVVGGTPCESTNDELTDVCFPAASESVAGEEKAV
jgi:hypothetical protein